MTQIEIESGGLKQTLNIYIYIYIYIQGDTRIRGWKERKMEGNT